MDDSAKEILFIVDFPSGRKNGKAAGGPLADLAETARRNRSASEDLVEQVIRPIRGPSIELIDDSGSGRAPRRIGLIYPERVNVFQPLLPPGNAPP
jgi:hypothetical protein